MWRLEMLPILRRISPTLHQQARFIAMSQEPVAKKLKTSRDLLIGTHNGTFHCDEALAVFLLRLTPKFKDAGAIWQLFFPAIIQYHGA